MADDLHIDIDIPKIDLGGDRHQRGVDLVTRRALSDMLDYAEMRAKHYAPRRTGNLHRNISRTRIRKIGITYEGNVGVRLQARYGKWVNSGTGLFGPFRTLVVPKTGNVMVFRKFDPTVRPGKEQFIFAKTTKGQRGQHFMNKAYYETDRFYVPVRIQLLKREIAAVITNRTTP